MAREMVNTEYLETKAQLHNQWIAESELLWKTNRRRLVYPSFPPFPTEDVIVARAKVLLGFLSEVEKPAAPFPAITQVSTLEVPTEVEITEVEVNPITPYNECNVQDGGEVMIETTIEQPTVVEPSANIEPLDTTTPKLVPSLLRRLMGS